MTAEAPVTVDLAGLVNNRDDVKTLSGQERGSEARLRFDLDRLDKADGAVRVVFPSSVMTISPSFLQGLLARSIRTLGEDRFRSHYQFMTTKTIRDQVNDVVSRLAARTAG